MGNGMDKIVSGLYVGNYRDAKDADQLKNNNITHILSIHDDAKKLVDGIEYLCIIASDNASQELTQFFPQCIDFIHKARLSGGNVLVHCLAGVSRSVTVTAAYLMTVTNLGWRDSLNSIRGSRTCANPNYGFQKQLQKYDTDRVAKERKKLREKYPSSPLSDAEECRQALQKFQRFVLYGDSREKDDGLYPLPPGAYKERVHDKFAEKRTQKEKEDSSKKTGENSSHKGHSPEKKTENSSQSETVKNG